MADVRALIVEDGVVTNAVLASEAFATSQGWRFGAGTENADIGWTFRDGTFSPPVTPPATVDAIVAERDRRLGLGFDHDLGEGRGVHRIGTGPADMKGWDEVTQIATVRKLTGSSAPIGIITDTGPVAVTPDDWLGVLEGAAAFRQPIWQASFALVAMQPIPADFAADKWWPPA